MRLAGSMSVESLEAEGLEFHPRFGISRETLLYPDQGFPSDKTNRMKEQRSFFQGKLE